MPERWNCGMPYSGRGGQWTEMPMDQFIRHVAWVVPPPPPNYNASEALTGQQLALLLRNSDPLLAL